MKRISSRFCVRWTKEKLLKLYFVIGQYISKNSRDGFWGKGAIDAISEQLQKELPGLRGFSARNLRNIRFFYEAWSNSEDESKLLPQKSNRLEFIIYAFNAPQRRNPRHEPRNCRDEHPHPVKEKRAQTA